MDYSHIFNKKILTIYWEIGVTTPFFCPQIRKMNPVGHPLALMGVVD
jgi:hypothetical protein